MNIFRFTACLIINWFENIIDQAPNLSARRDLRSKAEVRASLGKAWLDAARGM